MSFSQLHAWLNESSLPRAIADFRQHSFVAWNSTFLQKTGYSESRIKVIKPEDIIVLGDLRFQLPSGSNYPAAEFITCAIRTMLITTPSLMGSAPPLRPVTGTAGHKRDAGTMAHSHDGLNLFGRARQ
jgi:hypothetical protein